MRSPYSISNINFDAALHIMPFNKHAFCISSVYYMFMKTVLAKVQQEEESSPNGNCGIGRGFS